MKKDRMELFEMEAVSQNGNAWMMTMADLLSLMLVFFIMVFSMSTIKKGEWDKVLDALSAAFKSDRMVSDFSYKTDLGVNKIKIVRGLDVDYIYAVLLGKVSQDPFLAKTVKLEVTGGQVVASLSEETMFKGKTDFLTENSQMIFFIIGDSIQQIGNEIDVISYVKEGEKNWELSLARSIAASEELRKFGGLLKINSFTKTYVKPAESAEVSINQRKIDIVIRESMNGNSSYINQF